MGDFLNPIDVIENRCSIGFICWLCVSFLSKLNAVMLSHETTNIFRIRPDLPGNLGRANGRFILQPFGKPIIEC